MHISSFQLNNYKSYYQSVPLHLSAGINLIVGPNHASKTALLEGLRLDFDFNPYRSSRVQRRVELKEEVVSSAKVSFTLSQEELWEILHNVRSDFEQKIRLIVQGKWRTDTYFGIFGSTNLGIVIKRPRREKIDLGTE